MVFILISYLFVSYCVTVGQCQEKDKRLILNDMDAMNNRLNHQDQMIQQLQLTIGELTQRLQNTPQEYGSTYVRWGKSQCTGDAELVYSGYAAGQIYYNSATRLGGPSNMLCLPDNPELSNKTAPGSSLIWGSEFNENSFAPKSANEDVPCSLCRRKNSTASVMIPGRKTCYGGWHLEYNGRLASGCDTCKASSYICVDMHPDYIAGGETNDDHNLLFATRFQCGSLPCPPYHNNLEILCVVCTK